MKPPKSPWLHNAPVTHTHVYDMLLARVIQIDSPGLPANKPVPCYHQQTCTSGYAKLLLPCHHQLSSCCIITNHRYLAPELLNNDKADSALALDKADVFSLGCTLYELATGKELQKNGATYQSIRHGQVSLLPTMSLRFQTLIKVSLLDQLVLLVLPCYGLWCVLVCVQTCCFKRDEAFACMSAWHFSDLTTTRRRSTAGSFHLTACMQYDAQHKMASLTLCLKHCTFVACCDVAEHVGCGSSQAAVTRGHPEVTHRVKGQPAADRHNRCKAHVCVRLWALVLSNFTWRGAQQQAKLLLCMAHTQRACMCAPCTHGIGVPALNNLPCASSAIVCQAACRSSFRR